VTAAVTALAQASAEERGAVYTRRSVVEFLLDLTGYTADRPLEKVRLLEPSFGGGDFLIPAIERLLRSTAWRGRAELRDAIRAVELHGESFARTRARVVEVLREHRADVNLADDWLVEGDFLLAELTGEFAVVVGNPPYVRQELIPAALMAEYRSRYETIYDRADLYVPFIERSLRMLGPGGQLGFICADRWMKNRYGGPLRRMVADGFHFKTFVDMGGLEAFYGEVDAYPAITVIARERAGPTRVARPATLEQKVLAALAQGLLARRPGSGVREVAGVAAGDRPWILEQADALALVRRLEESFPALEETGCQVGIGVATGADAAFIGDFAGLDVEDDRKLPLVMTRDIATGMVQWRGLGVVNPFGADGGLVDLRAYPRLQRFLEARRELIGSRHVARKNPGNWFRTIDRIYPELARRPKLLIPDIKGSAHVVFEEGLRYPHHNLYYVTAEDWDLRALQAVLQSAIARLFVSVYSTKMRGGYLRFQAQYLRRIRIPRWENVSEGLRQELISAAVRQDLVACNRAAASLFGLTEGEMDTLDAGA